MIFYDGDLCKFEAVSGVPTPYVMEKVETGINPREFFDSVTRNTQNLITVEADAGGGLSLTTSTKRLSDFTPYKATTTETQTGTDTESAVTPAAFKASKIADRGDPSAEDFDEGDLTMDGAWRDLDLSSVVPTWARFVLLRVVLTPSGAVAGSGGILGFRKNGNSNEANASFVIAVDEVAMAGGIPLMGQDVWVACDSDQIIEYNGTETGSGFTAIDITVAMWM